MATYIVVLIEYLWGSACLDKTRTLKIVIMVGLTCVGGLGTQTIYWSFIYPPQFSLFMLEHFLISRFKKKETI